MYNNSETGNILYLRGEEAELEPIKRRSYLSPGDGSNAPLEAKLPLNYKEEGQRLRRPAAAASTVVIHGS